MLATNMPPLTHEERRTLEALVERGPGRQIAPPLRGRLALYSLIDETPHGWQITERGKRAIGVATIAFRQPINPDQSVTLERLHGGAVHRSRKRETPFD